MAQATLDFVKGLATTQFDAIASECEAQQHAFHLANNRHWQGLPTNTVVPDHDSDHEEEDCSHTASDALADKPSDQSESWSDFAVATLDDNVSARFRIDALTTPSGHAWQLVGQFAWQGDLYVKSKQFCTLSGEMDWALVEEIM